MPSTRIYGIAQEYLYVDLSEHHAARIPYDSHLFMRYIGGMGLGMYFLRRHLPPNIHPLSPRNVIVYAAGPLAGTFYPGTSRLDILTRSPLHGLLATSNVGASFAARLKYANLDLIILTGKAPTPVYIYLDENIVEFRSAEDIWGRGSFDSIRLMIDDGPRKDVSVCAIGPAGENRVFSASVTFDYYHSASRGGIGAVMGSKNLKGIVCGGDRSFPVAFPDEAARLRKTLINKITPWKQNTGAKPDRGVAVAKVFTIKPGVPGHNFSTSVLDTWNETTTFKENGVKLHQSGHACFSCPKGETAARIYLDDQCYYIASVHNSHIFSWGGICGLSDVRHIWMLVRECEDLGIDSISAAGAIGAIISGIGNGIIDCDTDRYNGLAWGAYQPIRTLLQDIAFNRHLGRDVIHGTDRLVERYGPKMKEFVHTIARMEWYPLDPREDIGAASVIGPLVSARVGDNVKSTHIVYEHLPVGVELEGTSDDHTVHERMIGSSDLPEKIKAKVFPTKTLNPGSYHNKEHLVKWIEDKSTIMNAIGQCILLTIDFGDFSEMLRTITGVALNEQELQRIAHRILTLQRRFNMANGLTRWNVDYPDKMYAVRSNRNGVLGKTLNRRMIRSTVQKYYKLRKWG